MSIPKCKHTYLLYDTIRHDARKKVKWKCENLLTDANRIGGFRIICRWKEIRESTMATFDTCNGIIYTIKKGDTLYSISGRFKVPLARILRANPYIDIYNLQIGEQICIPKCPNCNPFYLMTYIIKADETLLDVLNRFGIELDDLLKYSFVLFMNCLLLSNLTT